MSGLACHIYGQNLAKLTCGADVTGKGSTETKTALPTPNVTAIQRDEKKGRRNRETMRGPILDGRKDDRKKKN